MPIAQLLSPASVHRHSDAVTVLEHPVVDQGVGADISIFEHLAPVHR